MINIVPIKIYATGCYKRFVWLKIDDVVKCFRIDEDLYQHFKANGVPTIQALRYRK